MEFNIDELIESCCADFNIPEAEKEKFKQEISEISDKLSKSTDKLDTMGIKQTMRDYAQAVTDIYGPKSTESIGMALKHASVFVAAMHQIAYEEGRSHVMNMHKATNWN
ncbi:MAG: hypothetical protein WC852_02670 [Candidatus Nanoarchaeia archaeon]|jgi:hypothetical protein